MIIESLISMIVNIFSVVFSPINIPDMPAGMAQDVSNLVSQWLGYAGDMIGLFIPWSQVKIFFPILVVILSAEEIYKLVMWIVKKIPMLGIS